MLGGCKRPLSGHARCQCGDLIGGWAIRAGGQTHLFVLPPAESQVAFFDSRSTDPHSSVRRSRFSREMPKARVYKCSNCGRSHARPTGKHCQWQQTQQEAEREETPGENDVVVRALERLSEKMDEMGARMKAVEERGDSNAIAGAAAPEHSESELVVQHSQDLQSTSHTEAQVSQGAAKRSIPSAQELRRDYELG